MKIGFIGLGNMATAIIGGILKKGLASPADICGADKYTAACQKAKQSFGIETCTDNCEIVKQADMLVLAVKPVFFPEVMEEIRDAVGSETVIVSIAAGKTIAYI